jgi:hypothetical protein
VNAYEMMEMLRSNIGETVAKHWENKLLLRRLNIEHKDVGRRVLSAPGDWLLKKSDALTAVDSVITLPSDCLYPAYMEEVGSGQTILLSGTVRERSIGKLSGAYFAGAGLSAYPVGENYEVNQSGYNGQVYLWYQPSIIDLHAGTCGNGTGAEAIVFEGKSWPNGQDDYYNGVIVEVRDRTSHVLNVRQEITDYVGATFTATIAPSAVTSEANDLYGTVSPLAEELHDLIVLRATVKALAKPSSTFEKEIFSYYRAELKRVEDEMESFLALRQSGSIYPTEGESI